jgi:hypothetical protein
MLNKQDRLYIRALKLIVERGEEGILQRDIWQQLDATSRQGSRIALHLEESKLIKRVPELFNRRWTYRIFIAKQPVNIDALLDVPCMICEDIENCDVGLGISAQDCDTLTQWLLSTGPGR